MSTPSSLPSLKLVVIHDGIVCVLHCRMGLHSALAVYGARIKLEEDFT